MHITKVQDGIAALFNGSGKSLDSNWRSTVLTRWERIAASPTPTTDLRDFLQLLASHKDLNTDEIGATPDALRATAERSIASDITRIQEILSGQPSVDELLDAHRTWRDIQRVSSEMNLPSILQSAELNDLDQKFCNAATAAMRNAAATERNPTELAKLMRELTIIFNDGLMAKSQRSMQRASEAAPATTPGDSRIAYETNLH
jgi:hypothetical protein